MSLNTTLNVAKQPTANLTINKGRVKTYKDKSNIDTCYLQDGQEFEIELFNPTQNVILCKIELNNKSISQGGFVLNPGERVYIERYPDIPKKFKFETYEVEDTEEVAHAIKNNGNVSFKFYNEIVQVLPTYPYWNYPNNDIIYLGNNSPYQYNSGTPIGNTYYNQGMMGGSFEQTLTSSSSFTTSTATNVPLNKELSLKSIPAGVRSAEPSKKETGRVGQGSNSKQKFNIVDKEFFSYTFHTVNYKLLPISQKVNTVKDIAVVQYCGSCGAKQKKGNNFCPTCGHKH